MGTSWIDFYNQLTAGAKQTSQARQNNFFKLSYGMSPGRHTPALSLAAKKKESETSLDKLGAFKYLGGIGLLDDILNKPDDKATPGARVLDILSRGTYASAGYSSGINEARKGQSEGEQLQTDLLDILNPKALGEAWEGLTGRKKRTYADVRAAGGAENDDWGELGLNLGLDVALDPTTYIGPGAVKGVLSGLQKVTRATRGIDKAAEFAKDGLVPAPKAIEGLTSDAPTQAVGDSSFSAFFRDVTRNKENPGSPSIFDNIIDQEGNRVFPNRPIPDDPRHFIAGPEGISERLQLPGPPVEVLAARTSLGKANELASVVPKFEYGKFIEEIPDEGFFKITTRREPIVKEPVDPTLPAKSGWMGIDEALYGEDELLRMEGEAEVIRAREIAQNQRAAKRAKYADLDDSQLEGLGPATRTIMSAVEEPVYAAYEPKMVETTTEAGRPQKIKIWVPTTEAVRNRQVMDMGQIRKMLADKPLTREEAIPLIDEMRDPSTPMERKAEIKARLDRKPVSPEKKKQLMQMVANHVKAVEDWIKSGPAGYNTPAGYTNLYRELYGAAPKDYAKGAKAVAAAREKTAAKMKDLTGPAADNVADDLPAIPESPFADTPTYREVTEYASMDPDEKAAWLSQFEGKLTKAHMTYLAQASNPKSFLTRLNKLILLNEKYATSAEDLADAIADGRVLSIEEEGIPALLKHYNVKTLNQLEKAIRKDLKTLDAKEKKMFGRTNEAAPPKQVPDQPKELGPTGLPYMPFEGRAKKLATQAKEKALKNKAKKITPGEKIIQEVIEGNKTNLAQPKVQFNSSQQQMFQNGLEWAVKSNIIQPKDTELYKYVTRTGVKRTHSTPRAGKGRVADAWNVYSQYDFFRGLLMDSKKVDEGVKTVLNAAGVKGGDRLASRADYMYNLLMEPMRAMDEMLRAGGIFPVAGTRQYDTPFSFYDGFAALPPAFVKKNIFTLQGSKKSGYGSRIAPTQLMQVLDIGVASMKNADDIDNVEDLIRAALLEKIVTNNGKPVPNYMPALNKKSPLEFDEIVNDIMDSLPGLAQTVERNMAARKLYHENKQFVGTQASLDSIAERVTSPDYNVSEALALSNDVDPIIKTVTRTHGIDENDEFMVRAEVNSAAPEFPGLNTEARAEAKRAHLRNSKKTKAEKTKVDVDAMAESTAQATKIHEEMGTPLRDLESKFEAGLIHRMITAFFPHWGNETIRPMYLSKSSAAQTLARTYQGLVGKITQKYTTDEINLGWKELQVGRWSENPRIREAQDEINNAIGVMFSDDARYALFNRQGLNVDELNAHFEHYKIHPKFHFESDETMHNAWRTWDTNDPMDLLAKMFAATQKTVGKKLLGDQLMLEFGSTVKKPGYVKLANKGNEILRYIDTDTYYFPREIASQMRILDEFLKVDLKPTYSGTGAGALRVYDSALHAYKSGLTIYRPGHHMRNMVGDVWLSFMAGVTNPTVYKDALRVMRQMQGRYNDFDAVKALAAGDEVPVDNAQSIIAYTKIKGKRVGLTAGQIYRGMFDHGVLPDYRTLEDLQIGTEGSFSMPKVFGGRVHKVAATVSQSRDHYIRLAHGIDGLKKGNFRSLEDAMENVSHTVRKWHPDGSDLTHFESKVMRRTFMFYSWIRKAIPLILEGMVMRPGRAMAYPKAMYNLAIANGINVDSLSNPFPTDQLFPDYLTESLQGPIYQGDDEHYMGIQPGIPMLDVLGDYGGHSPGRVLMGSTTPLMKLPWEMATGPEGAIARDVRTDVPIFDKSDYLDKQIPNSNLFINTTGNSLTQFWESKGGSERDFEPDTQSAWINFLAGAGLIDMSRPGVIKQGQRDNGGRK